MSRVDCLPLELDSRQTPSKHAPCRRHAGMRRVRTFLRWLRRPLRSPDFVPPCLGVFRCAPGQPHLFHPRRSCWVVPAAFNIKHLASQIDACVCAVAGTTAAVVRTLVVLAWCVAPTCSLLPGDVSTRHCNHARGRKHSMLCHVSGSRHGPVAAWTRALSDQAAHVRAQLHRPLAKR
ncbi:MAG: hypothetical protein J3K34DRAFT_96979 [Monoraphidium minutum]|nr:MAG: hypothetical protein J3K34DRAFT_96979 [Monoraphidium minutum]